MTQNSLVVGTVRIDLRRCRLSFSMMTESARVWFILQYFGATAFILNGGWPAIQDREDLGLAANFHSFALLNLVGALLVYFTIKRVQPMHATGQAQSNMTTADLPVRLFRQAFFQDHIRSDW